MEIKQGQKIIAYSTRGDREPVETEVTGVKEGYIEIKNTGKFDSRIKDKPVIDVILENEIVKWRTELLKATKENITLRTISPWVGDRDFHNIVSKSICTIIKWTDFKNEKEAVIQKISSLGVKIIAEAEANLGQLFLLKEIKLGNEITIRQVHGSVLKIEKIPGEDKNSLVTLYFTKIAEPARDQIVKFINRQQVLARKTEKK